ncbi:MAG: DUF2804 domain-containing protein [Microbacteriaceae bacterium]|nr:DUF2804 domain-containing protein [Microbacteriaceae bacterium]
MTHRELKRPVPLVLPSGRLNPEAAAWSRGSLVDASGVDGRRQWWRTKRWEYWVVVTPTHILAVDVSAVGWVDFQQVWLLDRMTDQAVDATATLPFSIGTLLPRTLGTGAATRARSRNVKIDVEPGGSRTRLRATTPRLSANLTVDRWPVQEALGLVVPWSPKRFHLLVKQIGLPVHGTITVDGVTHDVPEGSWAVHDHGRGRWPASVRWQWGAAHGVLPDGRRLDFTIGGTWTVGTPSTENAAFLDGRLHKLQDELSWEHDAFEPLGPITVRGERMAATFAVEHSRDDRTNLTIVTGHVTQSFGTWSGWIELDDGSRVEFSGFDGFVEDAVYRW